MRFFARGEVGAQLAAALRRAGVRAGDPVVVAFSGGADSLALLALLSALPDARRPQIEAIHVDHGLRPGSAGEAARAVEVARTLGVAARSVRVAPSGRGGLEAAARRARYRALATEAAGRPILTAHTLDDQAETVLLRLARGTGLRGAAGIRPSAVLAGARVLRPLLGVRREALRRVVGALDLPVIEDPSNRDLRFARNRLRAEVLPALRQIAPGAVEALARFAELAAADERYLGARAGRAAARAGDDVAGLLALPLALRRRVVRDRIEQVAGRIPDARRVAEVLALLPRGGELHLPGGVLVRVSGGRFAALAGPTGRAARRAPGDVPEPATLAPGRPVERGALVFAAEGPLPAAGRGGDPAALWTTEPPPWLVREVRPGERVPVPGTGHRLASDLLSEARVPRDLRADALLVEARGGVIWMVGVRPLCRLPPEGAPAFRIRVQPKPK